MRENLSDSESARRPGRRDRALETDPCPISARRARSAVLSLHESAARTTHLSSGATPRRSNAMRTDRRHAATECSSLRAGITTPNSPVGRAAGAAHERLHLSNLKPL